MLLTATIIITTVGFHLSVAVENENLVSNGGFEKPGAEGFVSDRWYRDVWSDCRADVSKDLAQSLEGRRCIRVTIHSNRSGGAGVGQRGLRLRKGRRYLVQAAVRQSGVGSVILRVASVTRKLYLYYSGPSVNFSPDPTFRDGRWYVFRDVFECPVDDDDGAITVFSSAREGTFWVDDVRLEDVTDEEPRFPRITFDAVSKVSDPRRQVQFAARFMDVQIPFMAHIRFTVSGGGVTLNDWEQDVRVTPRWPTLWLKWCPLASPERLDPGIDTYTAKLTVSVPGTRGAHTFEARTRLKGLGAALAEVDSIQPEPVFTDRCLREIRGGQIWAIEVPAFYMGYRATILDLEERRRAGANCVDVRFTWRRLEPAPGKYDFAEADRIVGAAERVGIPLILTVVYGEAMSPTWLRTYDMHDHFGRAPPAHQAEYFGDDAAHVPSFSARQVRDAYGRLVRAVVSRYRRRRIIGVWHFECGDSDSAYLDLPWKTPPRYLDYSQWAAADFRQYLKSAFGLAVAGLRARYGAHIESLNDITLPRPVDGVDLRALWKDFQDYRTFAVTRMIRETLKTIRGLDTERPVMGWWNGALGYVLTARELGRVGGYIGMTGHEPTAVVQWNWFARAAGAQPITEVGTLPVTRRNFEAVMFNSIAGGVRSHCGMSFSPEREVYRGGVFAQAKDILRKSCRPPGPSKAAVFVSNQTVKAVRKGFVLSAGRLPFGNNQLETGQRLAEALVYQGLWPEWVIDSLNPELRRYRVVMDCNSLVLERKDIERLVAYARDGGILILFADSGRYVAGRSVTEHALLSRFGVRSVEPASARREMCHFDGFRGTKAQFALHERIVMTKLPDRTRILGMCGKYPGVVEMPAGHGRVILFLGVVNWNERGARKLLRELMALGGDAPQAHTDADEIRVFSRLNPRGGILALYNDSPRDATIEVTMPDTLKGMYRVVTVWPDGIGARFWDARNPYRVSVAARRLLLQRFAAPGPATRE